MMMERRQIVDLATQGKTGPLVTLVRVEGSSYRQTGARLLLSADSPGAYAGTISGGCLETEVVTKALWKVRNGPVVEQYSTLFDDTAEVPYGLGCGGTVDLLFEPAGTPEFDALVRALAATLRGETFLCLTRLPTADASLARAIVADTGEYIFRSEGLLAASITEALGAEQPDILGFFRESLVPPQRLIVFGAGDDAKPLAKMAALLGWTVTVVDGRAQLARKERFPGAAQVLAVSPAKLESLHISSNDAVVLMTHSYEQDREWLAALLPIAPRYLGVLGARHRSSLLVSEASILCGLPLAACCERIFAPVGLDLGGDGPEAIALAVLAEAHARCMGRLGNSRRLSAEDVRRTDRPWRSLALHAGPVRLRWRNVFRHSRPGIALMKLAAVVLARRGPSRRLGQPKQDLILGGETLLDRAVRVAVLAGLDPVYVVVSRRGCQLPFPPPRF